METLTTIRPSTPLAPYLGGKRFLSRRLCAIIGDIPHHTFVDVFVGGGGVFLRRDKRPRAEVINDLSGDVANVFRVARRHYEPLVAEFDWLLGSREEFARQMCIDPATLTDIERAARFIYLQRLGFGGKIMGRSFGVDRRTPSRLRLANLRAQLRDVRDRLAEVTIERLPYQDCIRRYDAPETLFYLDPPYVGCEGDYGSGFEPTDFFRMAEQLAAIEGKFVLSINDHPIAREAFGRFDVVEVPVTYTIGTASGGGKRVGELIVSNV